MKNKIKITPELARIVAHICADGYLCTANYRRSTKELISHSRRNIFRNKFAIRYVNTEPILIEQFKNDAKKEFNRKVMTIKTNEHEISAKWIYDIVKNLGAGKSKDWFIADEILHSSKKIKSEWLKAFFDDEAHVCKSTKRIVLNMVNLKGLKQVEKLLKEYNIDCKITGPYYYKIYFSYHLCIYRTHLSYYQKFIGFSHPKKIKDLSFLI